MAAQMSSDPVGLELLGTTLPGQGDLLSQAALAFLTELHRRYEPERQVRLKARQLRQAEFDAGALPDFRADTRSIREGDWQVAPLPRALLDRRVEITGPVDPKMVIDALNSGANCYMADFEDSTAPTWSNLLTGQRALRKAVAGTLDWMAPDGSKHYVLDADKLAKDELAVLMVRPRSACRISCISNAAGKVSISTVTFICPIGRPSRTSMKASTSSQSMASSMHCIFGR